MIDREAAVVEDNRSQGVRGNVRSVHEHDAGPYRKRRNVAATIVWQFHRVRRAVDHRVTVAIHVVEKANNIGTIHEELFIGVTASAASGASGAPAW